MKRTLSIFALLTALIALVVVLDLKNRGDDTVSDDAASGATTQPLLETRTDTQGGVEVAVTPSVFGADASAWTFKVVMDTHGGDLDDDMVSATTLVDDTGTVYYPNAWEGAPPGGHHREGEVTFVGVSPRAASFEVTISGVGGVPERVFTWDIQ